LIGKLKGKIDSLDDDSLIIDVNGVGYVVFCSNKTLSNIGNIGEAVELIIETHVREDHIHLFGFVNIDERNWFRLLTTVQGVGVKMALAILGVFAIAELMNIIAAKDNKSLTRVSGVGPKLAERIITELKNKIGKISSATADFSVNNNVKSSLPASTTNEDAISALSHLGFTRIDAYNAVIKASYELGTEAKLDDVIKKSLSELGRY
jgi:holliday junction DNA helicase RuvA